MNEETKKKTVNLEDLQISIQDVFNKGYGNIGVCSTAAGTATKEVTLGTIFSLVSGATVLVKFTYGITVANATIAITHTPLGSEIPVTEAAKPIYLNGAALEAMIIPAGAILILRYNGTQFDIIGGGGQASDAYTKAQTDALLTGKVDKVTGKELSTNDYTTNEKDKLSGIESGAQVHKAPTEAEVKSALGTGSGTSKYLREDGSWQTPPDTNTTYSGSSTVTLSGTTFSLTKANVTTALGYTPPTSDTNTWRTVQCNGTSIGNNTLNIKAGTNVSLSNSNGTITISSTDTNTWPSKVSQLTNDSGFLTAASFINNNKGTSVGKVMVADASNGLGYSTPSDLSSVFSNHDYAATILSTILKHEEIAEGGNDFCDFTFWLPGFRNVYGFKLRSQMIGASATNLKVNTMINGSWKGWKPIV